MKKADTCEPGIGFAINVGAAGACAARQWESAPAVAAVE